MLKIRIPGRELYDEENNEFLNIGDQTLYLEHSLVAISKWESKYHRPFIPKDENDVEMTKEEKLYYIQCMTLNDVDPEVYKLLTDDDIKAIDDYINDSMTATTFNTDETMSNNHSSQFTTSELIYYWMLKLGIPSEYENWHISRLFTLIRICEENEKDGNKTNQKKLMDDRKRINELRKKKYNTRG